MTVHKGQINACHQQMNNYDIFAAKQWTFEVLKLCHFREFSAPVLRIFGHFIAILKTQLSFVGI